MVSRWHDSWFALTAAAAIVGALLLHALFSEERMWRSERSVPPEPLVLADPTSQPLGGFGDDTPESVEVEESGSARPPASPSDEQFRRPIEGAIAQLAIKVRAGTASEKEEALFAALCRQFPSSECDE